MANYDPAQPLWKRNTAGILDFVLVFLVFGFLLSRLPGNQSPSPPFAPAPGARVVEVFGIGGWQTLVLIGLLVAYFVVMGRTGGTIFQRLFGMKRTK
jgi:hypothetical protein